MDDFKDSTKTQYERGGPARGAKGAAKISKTMGEFKSGTLHSGGKKGPVVTDPKQAVAIALSQGRKVQHKAQGGPVGRGNRVSAEEAGEDAVISRRRAKPVEADPRQFKNYDAPVSKHVDTPLQRRLQRRGPAGAGYNSEPKIGLKRGGLAVMPKC